MADTDTDQLAPEEGDESSEEVAHKKDAIRIHVRELRGSGDGKDVTYDIEVDINGEKRKISRSYQQLLSLYQLLSRKMDLGGHILPPMPALPPKSVDATTTALGHSTKSLHGNVARVPCIAMQIFLQALADHSFFSENHIVYSYLTKPAEELAGQLETPANNFWSYISKTYTDMQLKSVKDTDGEFANALKTVEDCIAQLSIAAKDFGVMTVSMKGLASSMDGVVSGLEGFNMWEMGGAYSSGTDHFTEALREDKVYLQAIAVDSVLTLGLTLDLHHKYYQQAKEMLYRRLAKLQAFLTCVLQLDKAKPEKQQAAESAKVKAEEEYQKITEAARDAMAKFQEQMTESLQASLVDYTEMQLSHSRSLHESLARIRDELAS